VTMHANGTEEVIHVVPYTTIRLRNTGTPIPFSSLKASYYGIELASWLIPYADTNIQELFRYMLIVYYIYT